jgi:predicted nuclease of predicted toxin-antitoxin system
MVRVLLDEGLPLRAAQWLRKSGIDAVHVREVGLASAPDPQILAAACEQGTAVTATRRGIRLRKLPPK